MGIGNSTYKLTKLNDTFGAVVRGVDLSQPELISDELRKQIIADVHKNRLLIFKNDGKLISAQD